ncbi:DeoR/GlpR family DNA-binding transcription regulator [Vibrio sp. JC009]|uniref:transcriptional repressor AgaR n=1 Tax=Vibrio sp. JC009 TaxID=2912314 RepID=UPI0023AEDF14|nr:transcriptional repressor AgaR [Vibrio sp. JC009]WED24952.1 DeoR/GlpR family DNA-binding transcription regulator [Vibrio sp. JC009]
MTSSERRQKIIELIHQQGEGKVDQFADQFGVSAVTIRHDLNLLEQQGCVHRCYGGATLNPNFAFDQPLHRKGLMNKSAKEKIASVAASLVQDGEAVILDSGSTIACMPPYLGRKKDLVVMTNALNTAHQLSGYNNVDLFVVGGNLRRASFSLMGSHGVQQVKEYRFDKLFLGVDGFDLEAGITTPNQGEAQVNRAMCEVSRQVIAVADSSKFGRKSFCMIRGADEIDMLITDSQIPQHYYQTLTGMGVEVILADKITC